jgi:hypothetical protein
MASEKRFRASSEEAEMMKRDCRMVRMNSEPLVRRMKC